MQTEGRAPLTPDPSGQGSEWEPLEGLPSGKAGDPVISGTPELGRPRKRRLGLFVLVAATVVVLDQLSKLLIVAHMADRPPISLLGGLLTITYTRNSGAAFSLGTGFTLIFTAVAVAVVVVIIRSARRLYSAAWAVALGGLLGGALGNLTDRMLRAPGPGRGHVVDWIQLPHFAVFNLADSAITCSAIGMVLLSVLGRDIDGTRHHTAPAATDSGQ
jgi:lipoprotein signal peptidase